MCKFLQCLEILQQIRKCKTKYQKLLEMFFLLFLFDQRATTIGFLSSVNDNQQNF